MRFASDAYIQERLKQFKKACRIYNEKIAAMTQDEVREDLFRRGQLDYTDLNEPHIIRGED